MFDCWIWIKKKETYIKQTHSGVSHYFRFFPVFIKSRQWVESGRGTRGFSQNDSSKMTAISKLFLTCRILSVHRWHSPNMRWYDFKKKKEKPCKSSFSLTAPSPNSQPSSWMCALTVSSSIDTLVCSSKSERSDSWCAHRCIVSDYS